MIEPLEQRRLLTAAFANGQLTLTSVSGGEHYLLADNGSVITVDIFGEGFHAEYPRNQITSIVITMTNVTVNTAIVGGSAIIAPTIIVPATINGSAGDDYIITGNGNTSVTGGNGADYIVGGAGNDTLNGGNGRAAINAQGIAAADDTILGGDGNDMLIGGGGPNNNTGDILVGGDGDDTIQGGAGRDLMDGGPGIDTLDYTDKSGTGVNVVFPNPQNPNFNGANPTTATNFPNLGIGAVTRTGGAYVVSEHDQLYDGLDQLDLSPDATIVVVDQGSYPSVNQSSPPKYLDVTANDTGMLNDSNFEVVQGSSGSDLFNVSQSNVQYTLFGNDGVDTMTGGQGDDYMDGGGNTGSSPRDGFGYDVLSGADGNDTLIGGTGNDDMSGDAGNDSLVGGDGNDILNGGDDNDILDGQAGNDLVEGGFGNDTLLGGQDGNGADTLQGDDGFDTVDYSVRMTGVRVTFDTVHDDGNPTLGGALGEQDFVTDTVEQVIGTPQADTLLSTASDSIGRYFIGGAGDDTITGGAGPDTLDGGSGNDSISGGLNVDSVIGGTGNDVLDYTSRTTGVHIVSDDNNSDGFSHVSSVETIIGGSGADVLDFTASPIPVSLGGGAGDDTIIGGGSDDTVNGGLGADDMHGGAGSDVVSYADRVTSISISFDEVANDGAATEHDNIHDDIESVAGSANGDLLDISAASAPHNIDGGPGNDTIIGSAFDDTLQGGDGDDSVFGGGGDDNMSGGSGNDTLTGGDGNDRMNGGAGRDVVEGGNGNDTLIGGKGGDTLTGDAGSNWASYYYETRSVIVTLDGLPDDGVVGENDQIASDIRNIEGGRGNDTLVGNEWSNQIAGGPGNDLIWGLNRNDTLMGEAGSDTLNGGNGGDVLIGGSGPDRLIGGKRGGMDTADYSDRTEALFLSLDNLTNDGALGEFDKIDADIAIILGGSGNDTITAIGQRAFTVNGGAGDDTISGSNAADSLIGGPGHDSIAGNAGVDTIVANDGEADTIDGGSSVDSVLFDIGLDTVTNVP